MLPIPFPCNQLVVVVMENHGFEAKKNISRIVDEHPKIPGIPLLARSATSPPKSWAHILND
jgi:hypothetical protein